METKITVELIQINVQLISAQLTAQFQFLCPQHYIFSYIFCLFWGTREIKTYKLGLYY